MSFTLSHSTFAVPRLPVTTPASAPVPLPPNTAITHNSTTSSTILENANVDSNIESSSRQNVDDTGASSRPVRLLIPSISLDTPIVDVGVNSKGEMDVPSGKTNNVGWYEDGTIPGDFGSAVLDAHVFAAFHRLRELRKGADVYVTQEDGSKLHFRVSYREVYPLHDVPLVRLFEANDARHLNLITCAGSLTRDHSTYDHRLIVYTTLVEDTNE